VVVTAQGGQGVGIIVDHPQHVLAGLGHQFLRCQSAGQQVYCLAQVAIWSWVNQTVS
jgi:hypothetical protein